MDYYTMIKDIILPLVGIFATPIAFYIGFTKGTGKTVDVALDRLNEKLKERPTYKRLVKMMEKSDEIFGDDQALEQITGFFREARALVSSPEAKTFFRNATEVLKDFSGKEQESVINLPKKPK